MDDTAVFKLSYGVFYLGCEDKGQKNVCVVNTVIQVTQEPLKVAVTVLKTSKTHDMIASSKKYSVGIMGENASMETIRHFGMQSGHQVDKLKDFPYKTDMLGNPLIDEGCIATLSCKVYEEVDLGTHTMFIADLVDAHNVSNEKPLTYSQYRENRINGTKKETQSNEATQPQKEIWQCTVCHYIYDGDIPFEDLPDDYVCPICKKPKSVFKKV
ncbi:flavin reductase [Paludicola sp. MB14-C6]|uniref:flavin reductase n=1 Tax=Paludihabitans sp. MB14-C6 TaxID=3070656 RepID=UPI0027DE3A36|nr:flavin reductase [Paludicola sp. MB14-C6]WMJ22568.1 flavin reductase [Paludicola sp. MB14-C6]